MAEQTGISWTDATFNAWEGCTKVAPECKHCYAETRSQRFHANLPMWGPSAARKPMGVSYWRKPLKWDEKARKSGQPFRVFCSSLSDVGERPDTCQDPWSYEVILSARLRLLELIFRTPHLTWMLLTKRPGTWKECLGEAVRHGNQRFGEAGRIAGDWLDGKPPRNVWMGTSAGTQESADKFIPELLQIPATMRFVSMVPLLKHVSLGKSWEVYCRTLWNGHGVPLDSNWLGQLHECPNCQAGQNEGDTGYLCPECGGECIVKTPNIHWVIVGGESGADARPMRPDWASAGIPFHFKQWGEWCPYESLNLKAPITRSIYPHDRDARMLRAGKMKAGRFLDGALHDAIPEPRSLYRLLQKDEIVLETDEYYNDDRKEWVEPQNSVGNPAPDPQFTSHRLFRRKRDDA